MQIPASRRNVRNSGIRCAILGLRSKVRIPRLRSAILGFRKFLLRAEHIYAIGVQTVKVNSMLALIGVKYAPKMANKNYCCDVLNIYRYPRPYYLPMPLFILFIYFENIGPAAAGPAGPVPTPMIISIYAHHILRLSTT